MQFSKTPDNDLVLALKRGENEALTEMFKRYWKPLYLTTLQKTRSKEAAEEIVQELFTELWDKRFTLFSKSLESLHLLSYLNRAVKNKALNYIREQLYDKKYWEYCKLHLETSENPTHELAEYNDLHTKLQQAVNLLSAKTRKVFVMNKLEGVPIPQLSKDMNLSEKAIEYHLTKSIKELKVYLRDFI